MNDPPRRERSTWLLVLLFMLFGVAGGVVMFVEWPVATPAPMVPTARTAAAIPPPAPARLPTEAAGPSFDIVRVGPGGHAVIAGRAQSGAEVTVHDGSRSLGVVTADAQGQFVLLPDTRLDPGNRELTLSARQADGTIVAGSDSVVLIVPPAQASAEPAMPPVAVLLPHGAEVPRVLAGGSPRKLALDTVDYDDGGEIRFAGSAKPDASVRVYVDNHPVGDARAGPGGQWVFVPGSPVAPGVHQLRVDQLGSDGRVLSRIELPFQRTATNPDGLASGRAVVQPGQNLWRIARQSYGQGTRYTVIYLANRDQIRDPNRIYPGQIFAVPPRS